MNVVLNRSTAGLCRVILGRTAMTESDPRVSADARPRASATEARRRPKTSELLCD
jgi:hypothetical protein